MSGTNEGAARIMAGIPAVNASFYHRIRFSVGDPAAWIEVGGASTLILRDIEMERAGKHARVDRVSCPAQFAPAGGLSGDRETATAQAAAECLQRAGAMRVVADRTLPLIYADVIQQAGIAVECDAEMGVAERRAKDAQEVAWLREAQAVTEDVMRQACEMVAGAEAGADGVLRVDGAALTSERVHAAIDLWLLEKGYANPGSIVSGGPQGADCHNTGAGPLRTGEPVIIDIFPQNKQTRYNGDCTRTVVHGEIPAALAKAHEAVVAAKAAAIAATRAGVTGEAVHAATGAALRALGYEQGRPDPARPAETFAMVHGTGHGIGLDVHEPPLLDEGGPPLVVGDALTIEPGLYAKAIGGMRVEDMVIVTEAGCENLNALPEGLEWR